jgi:hypothetical protein
MSFYHPRDNVIVDGKLYIPATQQQVLKSGVAEFSLVGYSKVHTKNGPTIERIMRGVYRNTSHIGELKDLAKLLGIPKFSQMKKEELYASVWNNIVFEE